MSSYCSPISHLPEQIVRCVSTEECETFFHDLFKSVNVMTFPSYILRGSDILEDIQIGNDICNLHNLLKQFSILMLGNEQ